MRGTLTADGLAPPLPSPRPLSGGTPSDATAASAAATPREAEGENAFTAATVCVKRCVEAPRPHARVYVCASRNPCTRARMRASRNPCARGACMAPAKLLLLGVCVCARSEGRRPGPAAAAAVGAAWLAYSAGSADGACLWTKYARKLCSCAQ